MPTLTAYENRVLAFRDANFPHVGKRTAKTIARMLCERQARMTDLDLERILTHSDPTPKEAFRNIERERQSL
jgi:hypothetical protein